MVDRQRPGRLSRRHVALSLSRRYHALLVGSDRPPLGRVLALAKADAEPTVPGVRTQPVRDPEVTHEVSLASMSGRRFSPAVLTFIRAMRAHNWSASRDLG